jgi:hypothetical protein
MWCGRCCATRGGSSPACVPHWSCCSCSRSRRFPGPSFRSGQSTRRTWRSTSPRTRRWRPYWTGSAASTSTRRPGSRPSTCCCSPRSSAAWCRACSITRGPCAPHPRTRRSVSTGCRSTRRPHLDRTTRPSRRRPSRPSCAAAASVPWCASNPAASGRSRVRRAISKRPATCSSTSHCSRCWWASASAIGTGGTATACSLRAPTAASATP